MNAKRVSAAAGVVHAAMQTRQTAAGIAVALESACLLQSPESAAEARQLRDDVTGACLARYEEEQENARLLAERHSTNEWVTDAAETLRVQRDRIAELEAAAEKVAEFCAQRAEYVDSLRNCSPGNNRDYNRWSGHAEARRQLSQLLGLPVGWPTEDKLKCSVCGSSKVKVKQRLFCPTCVKNANALHIPEQPTEDRHESELHHDYALSRDLPEIPQQQDRRAQ